MGDITQTGDRATHRLHLEQLDACLNVLEDVGERDGLIVDATLATKLARYVPGIVTGLPVSDAIELVFQAQEHLQQTRAAGQSRPVAGPARLVRDARHSPSDEMLPYHRSPRRTPLSNVRSEPLSIPAARTLTEQIRKETRIVCLLLLEAYEARVWQPLGYRNWAQYVRQELQFRQSRAYEFLDQARVIRVLQAAVGTTQVLDISAYAAGQIKSDLEHVVDVVRARVLAVSEERVPEVIAEVVSQQRQERSRARRPRPESAATEVGRAPQPRLVEGPMPRRAELVSGARVVPGDLRDLFSAIDYLARMPAPCETVMTALAGGVGAEEIHDATAWLLELEAALVKRSWRGRDEKKTA
jgi:hypothetical protein